MITHLYYNPSSYDGRTGHGYGTTKTKFTGQEVPMGSKDTGIYVIPHNKDEDDEDEDHPTDVYVDKLLNKSGMRPRAPIGYTRGDKATYIKNQARIAPTAESKNIPIRNSIAPISHKTLYPGGPSRHLSGQGSGGFDSLPMSTGAANQAFRTTGPARKTGTLKGTASSPNRSDYDKDVYFFNMKDFGDVDIDELNLMMQAIKIKKVLNDLD